MVSFVGHMAAYILWKLYLVVRDTNKVLKNKCKGLRISQKIQIYVQLIEQLL